MPLRRSRRSRISPDASQVLRSHNTSIPQRTLYPTFVLIDAEYGPEAGVALPTLRLQLSVSSIW